MDKMREEAIEMRRTTSIDSTMSVSVVPGERRSSKVFSLPFPNKREQPIEEEEEVMKIMYLFNFYIDSSMYVRITLIWISNNVLFWNEPVDVSVTVQVYFAHGTQKSISRRNIKSNLLIF